MKSITNSFLAGCIFPLLFPPSAAQAEGPLPECKLQGEQDARESTGTLYRPSLEGLFRQFETDPAGKDLHFVVGRLNDFGIGDSDWPHWESIRKSQQEWAEASPRIAWVNTDDLSDGINKKGETVEIELHDTRDGYRIFGERLAEAAISLIQTRREDSSQAALTPEWTRFFNLLVFELCGRVWAGYGLVGDPRELAEDAGGSLRACSGRLQPCDA